MRVNSMASGTNLSPNGNSGSQSDTDTAVSMRVTVGMIAAAMAAGRGARALKPGYTFVTGAMPSMSGAGDPREPGLGIARGQRRARVKLK